MRDTLRLRFVGVTVLCVLAPMAIIGAWIAWSARRSGEDALRLRLESSLEGAEQAIGYRWIEQRSAFLTLAADERIRGAAREHGPIEIAQDDPVLAALAPMMESARLMDVEGSVTDSIATRPPGEGSEPFAATVDVSFPVYESALGARVGSLHATIRLAYLLPPGFWSVGIGGGVVGLFDATDQPLVPSPLDADLLASPRFTLNGDDWVAVRRRMSEPPLQLALAAPLGPVDEPFLRATRQGLLALLAVSILALVAALLVTNRLTRSLEQLSTASVEVADGSLDRVVPEVGSEELRRLSRSFNSMTASLRALVRTVAQQRAAAAVGEFAASLAHEVRNPLTALRLDLEHVRGRVTDGSAVQVLDEAIGQVDRLDATVSGALRIAASGTVELSSLDLRGPVQAAARAATPRADSGGVRLELEIPDESLAIDGNATALEQLLLNLVLNGIEVSPVGSVVHISAHRDDAGIRVDVDDEGPGLSEEQLPRAFEPFFTTKDGGTGLGLAIALRIAAAHGGDLQLSIRLEGGARASLTLPARGHQA